VKVPAIVRGSRVPARAAVRCQLKRVEQYSASGSDAQEAGEGGLAKDRAVRTRKTETGSRFFECRPY